MSSGQPNDQTILAPASSCCSCLVVGRQARKHIYPICRSIYLLSLPCRKASSNRSSSLVYTSGYASSPPQMMAGSEDAVSDDTTATKPLTLFYNGSVAVFHLPKDKAEDIMKMAAGHDDGDGGRNKGAAANHGDQLVAKLREEMPIASKRSLQRFFQKRKERVYRPRSAGL
ncbi:hypothetical protein EJB05_16431, partial [Eragrostis curvula]